MTLQSGTRGSDDNFDDQFQSHWRKSAVRFDVCANPGKEVFVFESQWRQTSVAVALALMVSYRLVCCIVMLRLLFAWRVVYEATVKLAYPQDIMASVSDDCCNRVSLMQNPILCLRAASHSHCRLSFCFYAPCCSMHGNAICLGLHKGY